MNVLIIEDEEAAANRIRKMLLQLDSSINVLEVTDSVEASVQWLQENPQPDLILSDIQLADGSSFEIFREVRVEAPVIFTTAFDEYAISAFRVNSIDYLLKPVKLPELEQSLQKFRKLYAVRPASPAVAIDKLLEAMQAKQKVFQKRLVIRYGPHIKTVEVADVAYFYTQEKVTHLCTTGNKRLPVDHNLDELEQMLDPAQFFRINRQFIINIGSIGSMYSYSKSRVKIETNPPSEFEMIVSTERAPVFKEWLTGK